MEKDQIISRRQMKKAFFDRAKKIEEMMGNRLFITHPFAYRNSLDIKDGYYDGLTFEEFEKKLDDFEMDYLRSQYPEEFKRREQQQIEEARLRALAMKPGKPELTGPELQESIRRQSSKPEAVPSLEELINKTRANPNASVPIEVPKELRVGGRTRIL
jgi:hypothetical protein